MTVASIDAGIQKWGSIEIDGGLTFTSNSAIACIPCVPLDSSECLCDLLEI